ncbi:MULTISPECIES: hypothetical protein [Aurantimonadaceae]|uniref:Uncharacterized protein n=1 Tax=Jiella pelagia TaxID=2986949 RepID=A0ABY7C8C3_9HYPH|nr:MULTISPECIES: hypothetical protein [Aurantimonadaceae]WAP71481.1 hypothetical protein OH818_28015 [Jiella pelagia]
MKRQTRPFTVEVKRAKLSGKPASIWSDTLPVGAMQEEATAAPAKSHVRHRRNGLDMAGSTMSVASSPDIAPRILQDKTPGWAPQAAEIVRPKRGRPPKLRLEQAADDEQPAWAAPAKKATPPVAEAIAEVCESEAVIQSVTDVDPSIGVSDDVPPVQTEQRRSRRGTRGHIGERWKRHLPRWKR